MGIPSKNSFSMFWKNATKHSLSTLYQYSTRQVVQILQSSEPISYTSPPLPSLLLLFVYKYAHNSIARHQRRPKFASVCLPPSLRVWFPSIPHSTVGALPRFSLTYLNPILVFFSVFISAHAFFIGAFLLFTCSLLLVGAEQEGKSRMADCNANSSASVATMGEEVLPLHTNYSVSLPWFLWIHHIECAAAEISRFSPVPFHSSSSYPIPRAIILATNIYAFSVFLRCFNLSEFRFLHFWTFVSQRGILFSISANVQSAVQQL